MIKFILFIFSQLFFLQVNIYPIVLNQSDNFQDGTTQNWVSGVLNTNPPQVIPNGGPLGNGDKFLRIISTGTGTAGSKLVFFNTQQWTGDYISAGVTNISMWVNNTGPNALMMRAAFTNSVSWIVSSNPIQINPGAGWQVIVFSLQPGDLTPLAGGNYNSILSNVTQLRFLHSTTPNYIGEQIQAQLDLDVITAAATPAGDIGEPNIVLNNYSLFQNYPNPYNPSTNIKYTLPFRSMVSLSIYNILGDKVEMLVNKTQSKGTYELQYDGSGLSSGIYFYTLEAFSTDNNLSYRDTRKMIKLK